MLSGGRCVCGDGWGVGWVEVRAGGGGVLHSVGVGGGRSVEDGRLR